MGLSGFMYLVALTLQATFVNEIDEDLDDMFLYGFALLYVLMQICWIFYAIWARKDEINRSYADTDVLLAVHRAAGNVKMISSWKSAYRKGKNGRLLSFVSEDAKLSQSIKDTAASAKNAASPKGPDSPSPDSKSPNSKTTDSKK